MDGIFLGVRHTFSHEIRTRDGTFSFQNVPPGDYVIEVSRSGYITNFYGEMQNESTPPPHTLNPGQALSGVDVGLTPGAVIYGRLLDDRGEVVVGGTVQALKTTYRDGRRQRMIVQSVTSDDLGDYRLFLLKPGEYLVSVSEGAFAGRPAVPWFFPGTVDSDSARAFQLRAGESLGGVTFTSVPTRGRRVSGSIRGAAGSRASVLLSSRSGDVQMEQPVTPDGDFAFNGVSPGAYTLVARTSELKAAMTLSVQNTDILNANISLAPGFRIPVRVRIDGHGDGPDPDLEKLYFAVRHEPPVSGLDSDVYSPFAEGKLVFELLAGDYRLDFARPSNGEDMYLKSIRHGEIDVLHQGLRVSNSSDTPIEILVGTNPGSGIRKDVGEERHRCVGSGPCASRSSVGLQSGKSRVVGGVCFREGSAWGLQGLCLAGGKRRPVA